MVTRGVRHEEHPEDEPKGGEGPVEVEDGLPTPAAHHHAAGSERYDRPERRTFKQSTK